MPGPTLGSGQSYSHPPDAIQTLSPELYNYLYMLHTHIFGVGPDATGDLDTDNLSDSLHTAATTGHKDLTQGEAVADQNQTESVVTADFNALVVQFNALLASLRTAKVIGT